MHLVAIGLNHRTAPIEIRERLNFAESSLAQALTALLARPGIEEAAILSTCNRTEVYAATTEAESDAILRSFLTDYHEMPEVEFASHLYQHHGAAAVRHLFSVASGVDSLVLGEPQILRQVRDAFAVAADIGATGTLLNALFRASIATGKRARTETEIGKGGFSVGHAAVDLARSIFGSLDGATILILGAGKMSELTAKHLVASGSRIVLVANRTYEKAESLAGRLGGRAIRYDDFPETMASADVVISSTASPVPILRRDTLAPILKRRRGRPLFLIDIAVPRDIAPEVGEMENVFLYDVDDLEAVVEEMARDRASEKDHVDTIVAEEADKFMAWWRSLHAAPLVAQLKQKHEEIRQAELARLRNQLPDMTDREWQCVEAAMRSLVNRITRDPVIRLKAAAENASEHTYGLLDAARHIFALQNGRCPDTHYALVEVEEHADAEETTP